MVSNNSSGYRSILQSKIKVPADCVFGENLLLDLQMGDFSLCPHIVKTESSGLSSYAYNDSNSIMGTPPSLPF